MPPPHKEQAAVYDAQADELVAKLLGGMVTEAGARRLQYEHAMREATLHALLHISEQLDELAEAVRATI